MIEYPKIMENYLILMVLSLNPMDMMEMISMLVESEELWKKKLLVKTIKLKLKDKWELLNLELFKTNNKDKINKKFNLL